MAAAATSFVWERRRPSSAGAVAESPSSPPSRGGGGGWFSWLWRRGVAAVRGPQLPFRRLVVLGIHGWSVAGGLLSQPRATSERFCKMAEDALVREIVGSALGRPYDEEKAEDRALADEVEVLAVPLWDHGQVMTRVGTFHGELSAHLDTIGEADLLVVAAHSQGVPVGAILLADLLRTGKVKPERTRVCFLSMAGVHNGPFPDTLRDGFQATRELFEFSKPWSGIKKRHDDSMVALQETGVRIYLVGSYFDQVVPLHSAWYLQLGGKGVLRALFVDKATESSPFLRELFSLYLEHGLSSANALARDFVIHASGFMRGSLVRDTVHSSVHVEPAVYASAARWFVLGGEEEQGGADEDGGGRVGIVTTSPALWSAVFDQKFALGEYNRYMLVLRVRELLALCTPEQVKRVRSLFEEWEPKAKGLRQLRDRLEPAFADEQPLVGGTRSKL